MIFFQPRMSWAQINLCCLNVFFCIFASLSLQNRAWCKLNMCLHIYRHKTRQMEEKVVDFLNLNLKLNVSFSEAWLHMKVFAVSQEHQPMCLLFTSVGRQKTTGIYSDILKNYVWIKDLHYKLCCADIKLCLMWDFVTFIHLSLFCSKYIISRTISMWRHTTS